MVFATRTRRRLAWLSLIAALIATFMPTAVRAMASLDGDPVIIALCTAKGIQYVVSPAVSQAPDRAQHADQADHCPCCVSGACAALALPTLSTAAANAHGKPPVPAAFLFSARPLHAWATDQARGPPSLS